MTRVSIIAVGKLKERWLREACEEYTKRLGRYCKLHIVELSESRLPENPSDGEIRRALQNEAEQILRHIEGEMFALCIEGKPCTSEAFSEMLIAPALSGCSALTFVIGSSHGLAEKIKQVAMHKLSFSPMTFPHQLARVMLLEQIYRGYQIAEGGKYHK